MMLCLTSEDHTVDLPPVIKLWMGMVEEETGKSPVDPLIWIHETMGLLRSGAYKCIVAMDGETTVGFVDFFIIEEAITGSPVAMLRHAYIRPAWRKTGISQSLLLRSWREIKKSGCTRMMLVPAEQKQGAYERLGFKKSRVVMEKAIGC